jgi:hypothetical protein
MDKSISRGRKAPSRPEQISPEKSRKHLLGQDFDPVRVEEETFDSEIEPALARAKARRLKKG